MFWDEEYIDEKIEDLKDMIENNTFDKNNCNNFISYDDLEDEFSHNEIDCAQEMFIERAKEYLSKFVTLPGTVKEVIPLSENALYPIVVNPSGKSIDFNALVPKNA